MRMNSGIILAGQTPNYLNTIQQSNVAASQANEVRKQNALRNLFAEQGAAIAQGEQSALDAYAQFDPQAALGVSQTRQGMRHADANQQRADAGLKIQQANLGMREKEFELNVQKYAATLSAQERQAEALQIGQGLQQAYAAYQSGGLEAANQVLQSNNVPPVQSEEELQAVMLQYDNARQMLLDFDKLQPEPEKPADEYGRYVAEETAAGRQPLSRIDYAQAKKGNGVVMTTPDGTTLQVGGSGKALNETQSKNAVFATRARGALGVLEEEVEGAPLANQNTSRAGRLLEKVPLGLGRELQSPEYQVAAAAGQEFLQAVLRKDTGAAITDQEQILYGQLYLPQPGDTPQVLEYRRQARLRAADAIEAGMTPEAMRAQELALAKERGVEIFGDAPGEIEANPYEGLSEEEFNQIDIMSLTPEQTKQLAAARGLK